jgi:hypothetical protein
MKCEEISIEFLNREYLEFFLNFKNIWRKEYYKDTSFPWPDVHVSDRRRYINNEETNKFYPNTLDRNSKLPPDCIELLGCYLSIHVSNEYGFIVLFEEAIEDTKDRFMAEIGKSRGIKDADARNCLFKIILCHELMHWFMNRVDSGVDNWYEKRKIRYSHYDQVSYHETFAQIVTHLYCQKQHPDLKDNMVDIFGWLSVRQPPAYRRYDAMIANSIDDHKHIAILLHFMRTQDIQCYSCMERFFDFRKVPARHNFGWIYNEFESFIVDTKRNCKFPFFLRPFLRMRIALNDGC